LLVPVLIALETLVAGETCPAAVDVESRVRTILHLLPEQPLSESFMVERHEAGLYVVLRGADSTVIGERTLPLEGSCDELAQAAAVVLSAWLSDVHPDFAGALPPRPSEPSPPLPQPPEAQAKSTLQPALQPQPEPRRPTGRLTVAPPRTHRFEAGLALGADLTNEIFAFAGIASTRYGAEERGFGLAAWAGVTPLREESHEPGLIRWWRWPLGAGPTFRLSTPAVSADLSVGPVAAWLYLEGSAFDTNSSQDVLTWGGYASVRISGRSRALAPFGLLSLQIYPEDATAYVKGLEAEWPVPRWSLVGALGVRFSH
jgi:hypothetical protein